MRFLHGLLARVRGILLRRSADDDMDEELRFHLEMETEKYLRQGLDPTEARRRAAVAFGGVERSRERLREGRQVPLLEPLWRDLRFALRSVRRDPGLSALAAVTIALGVGATTAVFSFVNFALFRPLPIPGVERLVTLQEERSGAVSTGVEGMRIPYPRYEAYREGAARVLPSLAAFRLDGFALRLPEATVATTGALTSGNFFDALGVQPVLGRAYRDDEAREIVISHELWRTRFAADPEAVGRIVRVDGESVTVVGVAPPGFRGATVMTDDLWVPVGVRGLGPDAWGMRVVPVGRLAEGTTREQAQARVETVAAAVPPEQGSTVRRARLDAVEAIPSWSRSVVGGFLGMLQGMAFTVLLIASANIAGVLLARGVARRREMAVRLAMGAARGRVVRHLLAESLVIFTAGGAAGVGLAWLGTRWLARLPMPPQVAVDLELAPDITVLAFAVVVTGLTGVVFGLVPALQASRPDLVSSLKAGGHGATAAGSRARGLFVGGQVAFAVLLLLTAVLFVRSFRAGAATDLGFDPDGVVVATLDLGPPHDYSNEQRVAFFDQLLARMRVVPGVEAAGVTNIVLVAGERAGSTLRRPDAPEVPGLNVFNGVVDPGFFETMGMEVVAGRGLTAADAAGATPVAVINETAAQELWSGRSPLGGRLTGVQGGGEVEVVGVIRDGKYVDVTEPRTGAVFRPLAQRTQTSMAVHLRAPEAGGAALRALEREVRALDPDVALERAGPLEAHIAFSLTPHRLAAQVVSLFGLVGLVLAAMGIYGVLAYQVARRTRELGIRRALGARASHVVAEVVRQGTGLAAAGCAVGMVGGALLALAVESFLYGVRPLDPVAFLAVPLVLLGVAAVASWVPATRATAVEATEALRSE